MQYRACSVSNYPRVNSLEKMAERDMTVLFEFKRLRTDLELDRSSLCSRIKEAMALINRKVKVVLFGSLDQVKSPNKDVYYLRVWSEKWRKFVNVYSTEQVFSGDVITLVKQPSVSPQKVSSLRSYLLSSMFFL